MVEDHVTTTVWPTLIDVGFADTVTVGAGAALTLTDADALVLPPLPLQVSVYVLVPVAAGVTTCVPVTASVPLHALLAEHEVAFVDVQVNVELCPSVTEFGVAVSVTVGVVVAAAFTMSCADCGPTVPAGSGYRQDNEYTNVPVAVGVTVAVPLAISAPAQAPPLVVGFVDAVQGLDGELVPNSILNTVPSGVGPLSLP